VIPIFIEWGPGIHPGDGAPQGLRLASLRAEHPEPERIASLLRRLDLEIDVGLGTSPRLIAALDTPRGRVELR
jgi:hypothetical protein